MGRVGREFPYTWPIEIFLSKTKFQKSSSFNNPTLPPHSPHSTTFSQVQTHLHDHLYSPLPSPISPLILPTLPTTFRTQVTSCHSIPRHALTSHPPRVSPTCPTNNTNAQPSDVLLPKTVGRHLHAATRVGRRKPPVGRHVGRHVDLQKDLHRSITLTPTADVASPVAEPSQPCPSCPEASDSP